MSYPDIVTLLQKIGSNDFAAVEPIVGQQRLRVGMGVTKAYPFGLCDAVDVPNTIKAALSVGNIEDVFKVDAAELILVELRYFRRTLVGNYVCDGETLRRRCEEIEASLKHFLATQARSLGAV